MDETLLSELKRYVAWTSRDEEALRKLHPLLQPFFPGMINVFYDRILEHEQARQVLAGGETMVGHLKVQLARWLEVLFAGPWDEHYYEQRARIGRMHVRISLPQHYMFGAMNVLRQALSAQIELLYATTAGEAIVAQLALGKILDLELAIMLHTYREDLLSQQQKAERLATFGQLVGSIGHELRNPLGVMETSLHILKRYMPEDERVKKHTERLGQQLGLANTIINDLLDMIRDRPLQSEQLDLHALLAGATQQLGMSLDLETLRGLPPVSGDASKLRQVFINLLENARQSAGPGGHVSLDGAHDGEQVAIGVVDDGPGVDPKIVRRLFEPLVTTKPTGIGLGLSLVKRIVERHGGLVTYEPYKNGARFVVRLPLAGTSRARPLSGKYS